MVDKHLRRADPVMVELIRLANLIPNGVVVGSRFEVFSYEVLRELTEEAPAFAAHLRDYRDEQKELRGEDDATVETIVALEYRRIIDIKIALYTLAWQSDTRKAGAVRVCSACGRLYIMQRHDQLYCPGDAGKRSPCAARQSDKAWRVKYQEQHGHAYRQKRRTTKQQQTLERMQTCIGKFPKLFKRKFSATDEDIETLAEWTDQSVDQCRSLLNECDTTPQRENHETKRTTKARERS